MKHIAQEALTDFVRKSLPSAEERSIHDHLAQCAKCAETASLFRQVAAIGTREAQYEPPSGLVRSVKAYFGTQQKFAPESASIFELLFDSLAQPLAAGARASVASARQLLYRVGTVYVDMRVDSALNSEQAALVGQMLDSAHPRHPVAGVPVILMDGRKNVASTISNNNGEFHLEFALKSNLRLSIAV
ncbi:MAG: zf-HC2 domain-containing protein, partial [Acidobacteria bacterium]|nr:zf-HC2 domain-containing protein [Acidobacteriota bacterium]